MSSSLLIENLSGFKKSDGLENLVEGSASEQRVLDEMMKNDIQATSTNESNFSDLLEKSLETVNLHQHQANRAIKELVAGRTKNIHETMLAVERADMSLKLMMQVRNKVIDAYREIMKMQV